MCNNIVPLTMTIMMYSILFYSILFYSITMNNFAFSHKTFTFPRKTLNWLAKLILKKFPFACKKIVMEIWGERKNYIATFLQTNTKFCEANAKASQEMQYFSQKKVQNTILIQILNKSNYGQGLHLFLKNTFFFFFCYFRLSKWIWM